MPTLSDSPRALRILFLAPQPFFEVRGTPLAVRAMVETLAGLGHAVDLLTFPRGESVPLGNARHLRSMRLPVGRVRPGFSLAKLLLDVPFVAEAWLRMAVGHYDVVHAVEEAAHLAAPLARVLGLPLVMDVDSSIPEQLETARLPLKRLVLAVVRHLETRALRQAATVITICSALSEAVRRVAPEAPIFQIEDPPLVDATTVARREDVVALRRSLGLGEAPVVLYSGNFEEYQGVDLLVDAAPHLQDAQLVLMGGEASEIETLRRRAAELGVAHRVFFAGKRSPAELPVFLEMADVLVSPRRRGQNTPFKVYTYLASGKPLVATAIPTHTQFLHGGIATLVDASAEALAAGIRGVLADPLGAIERAIRGRSLIEREYGRKAFAGKVQRAYEHVARVAGARRSA